MALLVSGLAGTALAAQYSTTPRESDPRATASARCAPERILCMQASLPAWTGGLRRRNTVFRNLLPRTWNRPLVQRPTTMRSGESWKRFCFSRGRRRLSPPLCTSGRSSLLPGAWSSLPFSLASAGTVCWAKPNHGFFHCQHFCNTNVPGRSRGKRRASAADARALPSPTPPRTRRERMRSRKNILKTATRFATHRRAHDPARRADGNRDTAPTPFPNAFMDAKKSSRRAPVFASQHPICANSRAVADASHDACRCPRGGSRVPVAENETGRLRGRIGVLRERMRGVSVPLPRAVRRSRRGRGVRSTAPVPRLPPRTASRRRRRPR